MGHRKNTFHSKRFRHQKQRQRRVDEMQEVAVGRIEYLLQSAQRIFPQNQALAQRYIHLARRLAMATKVHIPPAMKRYICHRCKHLLVMGANMHIRICHRKHYGSYVAIICLDCGHTTRYLFKGKACRIEVPHVQSPNKSPDSDRIRPANPKGEDP